MTADAREQLLWNDEKESKFVGLVCLEYAASWPGRVLDGLRELEELMECLGLAAHSS